MADVNVLEKAQKILTEPVCDHCLGRQFAQLMSGLTNIERGSLLRTAAAMSIDIENYSGSIDLSNFHEFKFHNFETQKYAQKKCAVCADLFDNLPKWVQKVEKSVKNIEFSTFLVGSKLSLDLIEKEEALWERVGIDYCEPIKAEINRELGKLVEKKLNVKFAKNPDVNIILNFDAGKVDIEINPLFIYGEYQKLVRGIPQTKWPSGKYKTSVEQIIAKPYMQKTNGNGHKLHGMGREDIDARCLGWRPFVLEILEPRQRKFDIKKLAKKIPAKIKVRNLRPSDIAEVRKIKEFRAEKTYRAIVICTKKIEKKDLKKLSIIKSISQKTPQRVLHRRADRYRNRKIKSLRTTYINGRKFIIEVRSEAGLYIKELVSGDGGRTQPNVASILGTECVCRDLDVLKIHC